MRRPTNNDGKRKREKKSKRGLEAGESQEVQKRPRRTASSDIMTSDRPKKRSKEQLNTVEDADPVAAKSCNIWPDSK